MSNDKDYEQFEVSNTPDLIQSNEQKIKEAKNKRFKNKIKKLISKFFIPLFISVFLIVLILYLKNIYNYRQLEIKVMDNIFFPYHSDLITTLKSLEKLTKWITDVVYKKTGTKYQPSLRMYYKATRDGDSAFHEKTDKWEGYILLIKDNKNNIFGGYTSKNFKGNMLLDVNYGSEKTDKTAFLFNLKKNEIYPVINDKSNCHVYGDKDDGPAFGSYPDSDLWLPFNFLTLESHSEFPRIFNLNGDKDINKNKLRLTNGQKSFKVKELEVFRVNLLP